MRDESDSEEESQKRKKTKPRVKKKKTVVNEANLKNVEALNPHDACSLLDFDQAP